MIVSDLTIGSVAAGVDLDAHALQQFEEYLDLLGKWNSVYNLTAIREPSKWVSHHLLDSLAVVRHLPCGRVIDVGSGAGLPGIPIAVACASRQIVLLDSSQKKCAFLRQASTLLGLKRVEVVTSRVEDYRPAQPFDVVISRAFSDLSDFVATARHLCATGGRLLAMKGIYPHEEIAQLPAGAVERVERLHVPMLEAERHLVFIDPGKCGAT